MNKSSTSSSKVLANSVIYSISGLLMKCFSFFLLPLYTSYLSTDDYGITSIATSFVGAMSYIIAFSLFSAVMRFYVDLKDDVEKLKRFYGTIILFVFGSGIAWMGVITLLQDFICEYVFVGEEFFPVVFVCSLSTIFNCQHMIYDNMLKSQQRAMKSSSISLGYFLLSIVLNILFVVPLKMGARGVIIATFLANLIYTVYFLIDIIVSHQVTWCLDAKLLKTALKYSMPIMPHNLSTQITMLVSKTLIGGVDTLGALGLYSVASQFGNIADTIQVYVNNAYGPWLYEKLHEGAEGYKKSIRNIVNMISMVIGLFFLGIALFAEDYIKLFLEKSYVGACQYVPLVVLVFAIKTAYYFYVNILFYYKKASRILFSATLSSSIVNVILSVVFIPLYGVFGSILADAISMLIRVTIVIVISKRFEEIGLRVKDFVIHFFIVGGFIFIGLVFSLFILKETFSIYNFIYKVFVVVLYILLIWIRYRKEMRMLMNRVLKKRKIKGDNGK